MTSKFETREQWLQAAVVRLARLFKAVNIDLPPVRVSVGWPHKGGTATKGKVIGQCWKREVASDNVSQIFISPGLGEDEVKVLGVLAHELVHAVDDCESGHKGAFTVMARSIGLEGKMTETNVGPHLEAQLKEILGDLGDFPHAALDATEMAKQTPKQSTRMLKLEAVDCCGYTVRTTQKWIEQGLPTCPHGNEMELV